MSESPTRPLPLQAALGSAAAASLAAGSDRRALLGAMHSAAHGATRPDAGLAPVIPLRRPGRPGPDRPQAA